ncbi:MAG: hypothetical protein WD048_05740 [Chitinophagales bacterium]
MKKGILISAVLSLCIIFTTENVNAQDEIRGFNKGKVVPQLGIGLGGYGYYPGVAVRRGFTIPVVFGIEGGVHDYVGVGGYFGVATRRYNSRTRRATTLSTGARGTFHFYNMIEDLTGADLFTDKLDIYVGVLMGYEQNLYSHEVNSRGRFFGGGMVGIRYYPTSVFGVYAEVGRNVLSFINLGVAFRLGRKN